MASFPPVLEQIQSNIDLIHEVLNSLTPGHPEIPMHQKTLGELNTKLAEVQQNESLPPSHNTQTTPYLVDQHVNDYNMSPVSVASTAPLSRKRSLGLAIHGDAPEAKRLSANPSPLMPGTPDSLIDAPPTQQQYILPNRSAEASGSGSTLR